MLRAEKRLHAILKKAKAAGIDEDAIRTLSVTRKLCGGGKTRARWLRGFLIVFLIGVVYLFTSDECYLDMPFDSSKVFREAESCDLCKGINLVDRVTNITPIDFDEFYASIARPVVVSDATATWPAVESFSFNFFKKLYALNPTTKKTCQFFPYKTEFHSLREVLNMSSSRAQLQGKPWYIGWSNCDDAAGKILKEYYGRPYFLPDTSEDIAASWIFMGGPGDGAHMHVDNVRYPSWQAQLRGRKEWRLAPPPECLYSCREINVIVEPGEIIVVDTNRWYHQTRILPGDISITIGSEFD